MKEPIHHNSSHFAPISDANLSPAQAKVIAALAQGQTGTAAAEDAGVHRTTTHHWMRSKQIARGAYCGEGRRARLLALLLALAVVFLLVCSARPRVGGGSARSCVKTAQMSGFFGDLLKKKEVGGPKNRSIERFRIP